MNVFTLLRFLLCGVFTMGVVEVGGGSEPDADEGEEAGEGGEGTDESADDAGAEGEDGEEGGEAGEAAEEGTEGGDTDELVVTIGDEAPPENDGEVEDEDAGKLKGLTPEQLAGVINLRRRKRELKKQLADREAEIALLKGGAQPAAVVTIGEKPTFESCDFNPEKFETELSAWNERKRVVDAQAAAKQKEEQAARDAWQAKLDAYNKSKTALKVKDFAVAEEAAVSVLNVTQQGVILSGAKRPDLLIYAIGKNPKKAKELAAITDPIKFAFAAADLEHQLKVTPRKAAPVPERRVGGSVAGATAIKDTELERLQAAADKSGDRSKVAAYIRNKEKAKQAA